MDWQSIETAPAELVMTKIDDEHGARNEAPLKRSGRLWFVADGSMYVYYQPTHWRPLTESERESIRARIARDADALMRKAAAI